METQPTSLSPKFSVVIPVFNEEENLSKLTNELVYQLKILGHSYEIVFVDDGSNDNSFQVISNLKKENEGIRIVQLASNQGQSAAFDAGFKNSLGEIIITLDADLQNDPADIPHLLKNLDQYDMVCGWRANRNDRFIKRICSRIANTIRNFLTNENIRDTGCSLKVFRKECLQNIKLFKGMHRFFPTLAKINGFRVGQIKVNHRPRVYGLSKYGILNRLWSPFIDLLVVRWKINRNLNYEVLRID